ncbi:MAG: DUF4254 domain-containing protein [Acidobacteriaceae bacterium]
MPQEHMLDASTATQMFDRATSVWHEGQSAALPASPAAGQLVSGQPASPASGQNNALSSQNEALFGQRDALQRAILNLHRANFDLWHEEDKARDPAATDARIATVKRAIDHLNQQRNDLVEVCDRLLLASLPSGPAPDAPLHSETPGMMLDRLSILTLKIYHTAEEVERANAPPGHAERNRERLAVLQSQREDLAACLDRLWDDVLHGRRRFKLYQQMKMYNDPSLNPAVYAAQKK